MKLTKKKRAIKLLRRQLGKAQMVRIRRSFESRHDVSGFVLMMGKEWVLMARTSDGGFFDGLIAMRLRDVIDVQRDESFETRFALTRPEWPWNIPDGLALDSVDSVLWFFAERYPILGFQQEGNFYGVWIGRLDGMDGRRLIMRELNPQAEWWDHSRCFKKKQITSVEGGTAYQVALWAIANGALPPHGE